MTIIRNNQPKRPAPPPKKGPPPPAKKAQPKPEAKKESKPQAEESLPLQNVDRYTLTRAKHFDVIMSNGDKLSCHLLVWSAYTLLVEAVGELAGTEVDGEVLLSKAHILAYILPTNGNGDKPPND